MDDFLKSDSGVQGKSEKAPSDEAVQNWGRVVFQIYERMVHHSDVNFFLSAPQIISNLGFIMGVVSYENCPGLMAAYWGIRVEEARRRTNEIIESMKRDEKKEDKGPLEPTLKWVHVWSAEFKAKIGRYYRARRVYIHPKYVNPHNYPTIQCFRKFRVDEKVFDGVDEVTSWLAKSLKIDFSEKPPVLNTWQPEEKTDERLKRANSDDEGSLRGNETTTRSRLKINPKEMEKRAPIMAWTSHAVVELPNNVFDGSVIYTWEGQEFLRMRHYLTNERIQVEESGFAFNMAMIPTQSPQLRLLLLYDLDGSLCSFEKLIRFMNDVKIKEEAETRIAPVVVRRKDSKDFTEKSAIYMPLWKVKDFPPSRIGHHLAATIDLSSIFVSGGFGDLAQPDTIPSASGDPKAIGHIQHFGMLTIGNAPSCKRRKIINKKATEKSKDNKKMKKMSAESVKKIAINEPNAEEIEIIPFPILVILWDLNRKLPVYMGKVNEEKSVDEFEEQEALKSAKKSRCCPMF